MSQITPPIHFNELNVLCHEEKLAFIQEVAKRRVLWDWNHTEYKNKHRIASEWNDIACKLNTQANFLRSRWRNLCRIFNRELKAKYSHITNQYKGRWKYFQAMSFLKDIDVGNEIEFFEANENLSSDDNNTQVGNDDKYPIEFIIENDSEEDSDSERPHAVNKNDIKFNKWERIIHEKHRGRGVNSKDEADLDGNDKESLDEFEDEVFSCIPKKRKIEVMDGNAMFLKSLAPYFKLLEPTRKLVMRSKIQDVLLKEIADQDSCDLGR